ncbi:MAG: hypothetical protein ACD_62C00361G0001 [uncultured bacterium]|nr:MAG: hypothetical protein ACD_62C00361G0001 [uncultured bacterium]
MLCRTDIDQPVDAHLVRFRHVDVNEFAAVLLCDPEGLALGEEAVTQVLNVVSKFGDH